MPKRHHLRLSVIAPSDSVEYLFKVLKPLEREICFSRARIQVSLMEHKFVQIAGHTDDLTSLRSVLNGLLKSIYLALEIERFDNESSSSKS